MQKFTQAKARKVSIIEFTHIDGSTHGGVVGGTQRETFSVVSFPRYGDTKGRRFRYDEVADYTVTSERNPVPLATFDRLMQGIAG